jgi:hypothetical protein
MSEITMNAENFIGYEYKDVTTSRELEGVYADGYPNFGWKLERCAPSMFGLSTINMKFKRDRKIRNKAELSRLQRQFDSGIAEIENLERSKTTAAMIVALAIGLIGSAFIAGATFAFIYAEMIPLMIILAVPGFIGWFLPYMLYKKIKAKRSATVASLVDKQFDYIYEVCEQGHVLLAE